MALRAIKYVGCVWVAAAVLFCGAETPTLQDTNETVFAMATEAALLGDVALAAHLFLAAALDARHLRCAALLHLVMNDPGAALQELRHARDLEPNGHRGGCPGLQELFFSSAVVLMRLRDEGLSPGPAMHSPLCDEHVSMAVELEVAGHTALATAHLASAALSLGCSHSKAAIALHDALLCPHYFDSKDDIGMWRARLESSVARLTAACEKGLEVPAWDSFSNPGTFDVAYMGRNDAPLMVSVARLYACLDPSLATVRFRQHNAQQASGPAKVKVGFFSAHFRMHSVCKLWCGVVSRLNRAVFEVHVILASDAQDKATSGVCDGARVTRLANGASDGASVVGALGLDVLVFPSMGMHQATYMWAHSRMARVVVGTWGHPVTSGLPSVDYFISSDLFVEPSAGTSDGGAEKRFTEQLVRFDSTGFYFPVPPGSESLVRGNAPPLPLLDELLGRIEGPLVACPQALMKLHPSFDAALADILRGYPTASLVLLHDPHKPQHVAWRKKVERRLSGALGADASQRLVFLPRLSALEFLGLLRRSTLVLDPFPFGGGVTSLEAFAVCAPIVTAPLLQTVPALAAGMYRRMGVGEAPVVRSERAYVAAALELLRNTNRTAALRESICARRSLLFEDQASAEEWALFLRRVASA